ncbi:MAG: hypothetical protein HN712_16905 [Gemmatimonadetes bacterium]|jgi:hypothetical protein|nr:hypothetical protein [Gemmatimonadota bacterium]MBT6143866.1 hypothetical protein [Gemmatimonadota bacterium]MBT7861997.1 hypothetical protein [Gemmatimonadota bacterium]
MRTIFVGDLHGCAAEFETLLETIGYTGRDRLLLAGDAFSRGPDPLRVWELILATGAEMVLGNHDARLLLQLDAHAAGDKPRFKKPDQKACYNALRPVFDMLHPWLQSVPLKIDEERFLLVHAGIHPLVGVDGTSRQQFITIRTWPPTDGIKGPRWHDVIEPFDDRMIIFGHDAPGGLVVKRHAPEERPHILGLDSGCIYGGQLTAYLYEEDRLVQVPSQQDGKRWR